MPHPTLFLPSTRLRRSYEHARAIDGASQIQECADLLSNPELIVAEIDDAYRAVETFDTPILAIALPFLGSRP